MRLFYGMCFVYIMMIAMMMKPTGGMEKDTEENINAGLQSGVSVLDGISKMDLATDFLSKAKFEKLAGCLGAVGGFISFALIFFPKQDSAELLYMKSKFAEMNQKFEIVFKKLDTVKDLVKLENQKAVYVKEAAKIAYAYRHLFYFIDEVQKTPCHSKKDCLRKRTRIAERYVKRFDIKPSLYMIMKGVTEKISVFGEPLLKLISEAHPGNIGRINHFVNGVVQLMFQAQQVVMAHEKLMGSKISITMSLSHWFDGVYKIRQTADKYKSSIFQKITQYMETDINDPTYQVNFHSNKDAARTMRIALEQKYSWLNWVVFAYGAYGWEKHTFTTSGKKFYNMPKDRNKRKRTIIAIPQGKGSYLRQREDFDKEIRLLGKTIRFYYREVRSAKSIYLKLSEGLRKTMVYKSIRMFAILRDVSDLQISANGFNFLNWYNEEIPIQMCNGRRSGRCRTVWTRVAAVFKSEEEINYTGCKKTCGNHGKCKRKPYSGLTYCNCNFYYQGENCESHTKLDVAKVVEGVFDVALKIPQLGDISFDIKDMKEELGASIGNIKSAITILDNKMQKAFHTIGSKIDQNFKWANLITVYSNAFKKLMYFKERFNKVQKSDGESAEEIKLAKSVLQVDALPYWLYQINLLIIGRNDALMKHKPVMLMVMEKYRNLGCTKEYKAIIKRVGKEIQYLQFEGYLLMIRAKAVLGLEIDGIQNALKNKIYKQIIYTRSFTCSLNVRNSINAKCDSQEGEYNVFRGLTINLKCKNNFYISGPKHTSCNKPSKCLHCNCDTVGSVSKQCNSNGKCHCRPKYYGVKCANRNCEWSAWGGWSSCGCGNGRKQRRIRHHSVTKKGAGRNCSGGTIHTRFCFNRCCSHQFHCTRKNKCLHSSLKCNYIDNCGNKQDEQNCNEHCYTRYTRYDSHGGGNLVYLDRQHPYCGSNEMMGMFHMQRNGGSIRYQYTCCRLKRVICNLRWRYSGLTYDGRGNTVYLDRQRIDCGYNQGFLQSFHLRRHGNHVRYRYGCCYVNNPWRSHTRCYTGVTGYTYDGNGKNFYLDRQTVRCASRYFLNYIRLERNSRQDHWRFRFRCCKVQP